MRLQIVHHTRYNYSEKVFLEPHYLNFRPQARPCFDLIRFDLQIDPNPSGLYQRISLENNYQHQCWFNELTDHLEIRVEMEIETWEFNPFGFFHDDSLAGENHLEKIYTRRLPSRHKEIDAFLKEIVESSGDQSMSLFTALLTRIKEQWEHEVRYESSILEPVHCFAARNGSCRDLTWMMMHMLGQRNIPTRFVSGYAHNPELGEGHELHAWLETFVPGAGWLGLDPSAGLFATSDYIPVAVSYHPKNTMPVIGNYRGKTKSQLETKVVIKEI